MVFGCVLLLLLHSSSILIVGTSALTGHTNASSESVQLKSSNDTLCSQPPSTRNVILTLLSATISIFGVLGNALVIAVVSLHSKIRRKNRFFLLMSLAIADIGVSIFLTTLKANMFYHNGNFCMAIIACSFFQLTDTLFPVASMTHILIITIDRWIAIRLPYDHSKVTTGKIRKRAVVCVWIYSVVWVLCGTFKWESPVSYSYAITQANERRFCYSYNRNYNSVLFVSVYILPVLTIVLLNFSVIQEMRSNQTERNAPLEKKINSKALKMVITVTLVFILCWMPHCIIVALSYWWAKPLDNLFLASPDAYDLSLTVISNILPTLNSSINPLIYCALSRNFQIALGDLLRQSASRVTNLSPMQSIPAPDRSRGQFSAVSRLPYFRQ